MITPPHFGSDSPPLSEMAPLIGRAMDIPAENVAGFVIVGIQYDGEVGIAASENISPHMVVHLLDATAARLSADVAARQGRAEQN